MPPLNNFTRSCLALAISQAVIAPVNAATIEVDTSDDNVTLGGDCTLREAIISANNDTAAGSGCKDGNGTDAITFTNAVGPIITLTSTLPTINTDTTITGQGELGLTIDADGNGSVLHIDNATVSLSSLNLIGGSGYFNFGGGLYVSSANLDLSDCAVSNNTVSNAGGGLHGFNSSIDITNCTFSNNQAVYAGGLNLNTSDINLTNSTISNNSATNRAGGLRARYFSSLGSVDITNSTIANNTADVRAGGLFVERNAKLSMNHSTVTGNIAVSGLGGGIYAYYSGTVTLANSIIAGNNSAGSSDEIQVFMAVVNAANNNLIGDNSNDQAGAFNGFFPSGSDIDGTSDNDNIALLSILKPLDDNGGPTQTNALSENSPALDAGNNTDCGTGMTITTDQRGELRDDGACDIGAFEGFIEDSTFYVVPLPGGRSVIFSL